MGKGHRSATLETGSITTGFEAGRQQHMWPTPSVIAPSFIPSHPAHQWEKWWMSGLLKAWGALMVWHSLQTLRSLAPGPGKRTFN